MKISYKILCLALITFLVASACNKKKMHAPDSSATPTEIARTIDNANPVKNIDGDIATLEKPMPELKTGDYLYFPREPFQFQITEVDANGIVKVKLGPKHDVQIGQMLTKHSTNTTKKNIDTVNRLEGAVE